MAREYNPEVFVTLLSEGLRDNLGGLRRPPPIGLLGGRSASETPRRRPPLGEAIALKHSPKPADTPQMTATAHGHPRAKVRKGNVLVTLLVATGLTTGAMAVMLVAPGCGDKCQPAPATRQSTVPGNRARMVSTPAG